MAQATDVVARVADAIRAEHSEVVFGESNDDAFRRLAEAAIRTLMPELLAEANRLEART